MSKKKLTDQELKDALWAAMLATDLESGDDIFTNPSNDALYMQILARQSKVTLKVPGFEGSATDIAKILKEVEDSCLTDKCKKSLTKALKSAK